MSKSRQKKEVSKHRAIISAVIAAISLTIAFAVGDIVSGIQHRAAVTSLGSVPTNTPNETNVTGLPTTPIPNSVVNAQNLIAQGKYDEAQKAITSSIVSTNNTTEKYELYIEQGVTYENQQKYQDAIDAYGKANVVKPFPGTYDALARVALLVGNKQLAIDSYMQEIALLPASAARTPALKQQLEAKIEELQK